MKYRKAMFLVLAAAMFHCSSFAQDQNYKNEAASGYKGGFIKGIKLLPEALNFIVVGDWGRQGEYHQSEVAMQMSHAAVSLDIDFVISTGDNFYPDGVASIHDPLWRSSFEDVYKHFSLQKKWYVVLGNHDYRSNAQAQVDYTSISSRWQMPSRYFSKKFTINGDPTAQVLFVFIDTSPFVKKYYNDEVYVPGVSTEDTTRQKQWIDSVLSDPSPNIKWKIVTGHHPAYSAGPRMHSPDTKDIFYSLKPFFDKHKVDLVLSGHEHHLEYTKPEGRTHYFISGAGSETRPAQRYPQIGKFATATPGFFSFSISPNQIMVHAIDASGKIIYTTEIKR